MISFASYHTGKEGESGGAKSVKLQCNVAQFKESSSPELIVCGILYTKFMIFEWLAFSGFYLFPSSIRISGSKSKPCYDWVNKFLSLMVLV